MKMGYSGCHRCFKCRDKRHFNSEPQPQFEPPRPSLYTTSGNENEVGSIRLNYSTSCDHITSTFGLARPLVDWYGSECIASHIMYEGVLSRLLKSISLSEAHPA